jgi:hypothetical protein
MKYLPADTHLLFTMGRAVEVGGVLGIYAPLFVVNVYVTRMLVAIENEFT